MIELENLDPKVIIDGANSVNDALFSWVKEIGHIRPSSIEVRLLLLHIDKSRHNFEETISTLATICEIQLDGSVANIIFNTMLESLSGQATLLVDELSTAEDLLRIRSSKKQ